MRGIGMEKVKVKEDFTIKLPEELKKSISEGDEFMIMLVGDSIRLKRIKKPDILDLAASVEDKEALSLEEISRIVHKLRGVVENKGSN
jgi:antitoxin component of MazEF toxin-antitoxin module